MGYDDHLPGDVHEAEVLCVHVKLAQAWVWLCCEI